jgi:hypothetical protein
MQVQRNEKKSHQKKVADEHWDLCYLGSMEEMDTGALYTLVDMPPEQSQVQGCETVESQMAGRLEAR